MKENHMSTIKKTRETFTINEEGSDENKLLATLWEPTTAGQYAFIDVKIESHAVGDYDDCVSSWVQCLLRFDGSQVGVYQQSNSCENITAGGSIHWALYVNPDYAMGGDGSKLIAMVHFESGPWDVEFTISYEIEEFVP
jgi:hypothetical protein